MKLQFTLTGILFTLFSFSSTITDKIVVDQFGYRPNSKKVAVLRNPITGPDAAESFSPGTNFAVIRVADGAQVLTGSPTIWNGGAEDASSGDKAWWFDFSLLTDNGSYYVLDIDNDVRSFEFEIKEDIYNEVLKHAVRALFYQRSGHAKDAAYAGANWADGASHLKDKQDLNCRKWDTPDDATSERDVHGGWYDAGDFNKYTIWTADYVVELLKAYRENPNVWGDDYNIPESGNGIPDVIDEVKWGLDHLLRLQYENGSCIAIVDADQTSPPSIATGPSLYGNINTASTNSSAAAFALGSIIFEELGQTAYATTLEQAAIKAWDWADANPNVQWKNNDAASGTSGIGAGQQEVNDYGRFMLKMRAATYLFELTGSSTYDTYVNSNYLDINMMQWVFAFPFQDKHQDLLLHHASITPNATVSDDILDVFERAMDKEHNFAAVENSTDPYMAHMDAYTWGSNRQKSSCGIMFWQVKEFLSSGKSDLGMQAAEDYLHYLHGVNPMNLVYLTNMGAYGAENSVSQIYHDWFKHDTDWDEVGVSVYGPAPGIMPGGPNPSYDWDGCCPSGCGSTANNEKCYTVDISVVKGQPKQKSYLSFNEGWPLNSWEITEPSLGYQTEYIRLVSKFAADINFDTNTDDVIGNKPILEVYPNPSNAIISVMGTKDEISLLDLSGSIIGTYTSTSISIEDLAAGMYIIESNGGRTTFIKK